MRTHPNAPISPARFARFAPGPTGIRYHAHPALRTRSLLPVPCTPESVGRRSLAIVRRVRLPLRVRGKEKGEGFWEEGGGMILPLVCCPPSFPHVGLFVLPSLPPSHSLGYVCSLGGGARDSVCVREGVLGAGRSGVGTASGKTVFEERADPGDMGRGGDSLNGGRPFRGWQQEGGQGIQD